jgi:ABC-2 type transport system ATP-binding protein
MKTIEKLPGISEVAVFGGGLHVTAPDADAVAPQIRDALERAGIAVTQLQRIQPSMEDVFVAMIEKAEKERA